MSKLVRKINELEHRLKKSYRTLNTIEISKSAILHNFDLLKSLHKSFDVIPVLKSNAYGHGLDIVAEILRARTFPYIAVDGYFEALRIRAVSSQPVLIMGAIHPENYQKLRLENFTFVVGDKSQLKLIGSLNKKIKIHLDINTGMNRQGFHLKEIPSVLRVLTQNKKLELEGVMSHLADADNPKSNIYSKYQIQNFDMAINKILYAGFKPKYIHLANSPGSAKLQSRFCNAIRPGLALYGLNPLTAGDKSRKRFGSLVPALTLKSTVIKIINLEKGDEVSYNGIFKARGKTRVGVVPLGYYEGIRRELSNNGWISHKRIWLRYVGRVCMNHTVFEIGNKPIRLWDEVIVISSNPKDRNSVAKICSENNLFNYEFIAGLNQNIRRTIVA